MSCASTRRWGGGGRSGTRRRGRGCRGSLLLRGSGAGLLYSGGADGCLALGCGSGLGSVVVRVEAVTVVEPVALPVWI